MSKSYLRCRHCRGFYELALSACRYCGKNVPMKNGDGSEKVFADRETCRAIQIAEFEQLPAEAHDDCFQPDPELLDKLCYCLHCGPDGGLFEAVEMRWMVHEQMWACPCTRCGGRGFNFDVHLSERLWQCVECRHWYTPENNDFRAENAKCPKCGCTTADGWFDDGFDEEELTEEDMKLLDEEAKKSEAKIEGSDAAGDVAESHPENAESVLEEAKGEAMPWSPEEDGGPDDDSASLYHLRELPDDIDFPHDKSPPRKPLDEDDIPW